MWTPSQFFYETMVRHESDRHSLDPVDKGNWFSAERYRRNQPQIRGVGELVGSKFGVTPEVLARHLGVAVVTRQMMSELTAETASEIAVDRYYKAAGLDKLPWNRATMAVFDMAYNAGGKRAVQILQESVGVAADGKVGPQTFNAVANYLNRYGEDALAVAYADKRKAYYLSIAHGANAKYKKGWLNRANSFLPQTSWWRRAG